MPISPKAYKYEIFPDDEQKKLIDKTIGCCRYVWNWALDRRKSDRSLTSAKISKELTNLKKELDWLTEPNSQALVEELRHLDGAFKRFFQNCKNGKKGKKGFPRFKRRGDKASFSNQQTPPGKRPQNRLDDLGNGFGHLTVIKLPNIKIRLHRPFQGRLGTVTISRTASGRYFASLVSISEGEFPEKTPFTEEGTIGIDRGLKTYLVVSDGCTVENPRFFAKKISRLKVLDRRIAKKRERNPDFKNSKKYRELLLIRAKLHEKVVNQRVDFLHKTSHQMVSKGATTIAVENLNVSGMMKNRRLARHIADASWYEFGRQLKYKSEEKGIRVHEVGRFEPTSKTCHVCGTKKEDLLLSDRQWTCGKCGTHHDRDLNAAIMIKKTALADLGRTPGQAVRPKTKPR